jgi:hypothetical protein
MTVIVSQEQTGNNASMRTALLRSANMQVVKKRAAIAMTAKTYANAIAIPITLLTA